MKIIISASYGGCGSEINKYIAQPRAGRTANSQLTNVVAIMTIRIAFTLRYLAMNRFYRKRCMFDDGLFFFPFTARVCFEFLLCLRHWARQRD